MSIGNAQCFQSAPQAAQLDGKAGIIQALFEEGGTLAHLGLGFRMFLNSLKMFETA